MKAHRKKPEVKRKIITEGNVKMDFNAVPNIEWKFIVSDLMPCLEEFFANPDNAALAAEIRSLHGKALFAFGLLISTGHS